MHGPMNIKFEHQTSGVFALLFANISPTPQWIFWQRNISPYLNSRLTINRNRDIVRKEIYSQWPFSTGTHLSQSIVLRSRSWVVSSASSRTSQTAYFVCYNYCLFRLTAYLIEITTSLRYEDRVWLYAFLIEKCHSSCLNIWWWAFT